jgi:ribonuclease P protein component
MLRRANRMNLPREFRETVRGGTRAGSETLVVHLLVPSGGGAPPEGDLDGDPDADTDVRIGFIVNKAVGSAVVRNRVRRRLRHLCRPLLAQLPPGSRLVLRATPAAPGASAGRLSSDLASCLGRSRAKAQRTVTP